MVDHDDQNKNPEHEPSQKQLQEFYGRLFGIATRHRNSRIDEHASLEGQRELPPPMQRPGDTVSHSYHVTMTRPELELCGIEHVDRIDVSYADPRMLDDEPADGMTLLYILAGSKEEILDVTYDAAEHRYSGEYDVRMVSTDVGDDELAFVSDSEQVSEQDLDAAERSLSLDLRPIDEELIARVKSILRKIETGFAIH